MTSGCFYKSKNADWYRFPQILLLSFTKTCTSLRFNMPLSAPEYYSRLSGYWKTSSKLHFSFHGIVISP